MTAVKTTLPFAEFYTKSYPCATPLTRT